jgi:YVTN family beta-propeller protein
MRYGILGHLELHDGDGSVPIAQGHQRLLLAVLLVHANEAVASERLVDALWTDSPPPSALRSLHNLVSALRRVLGDGRLVTEAHGYRLRVGDDDLDAWRFLTLSARGRQALAGGEPARAASLLGEALALWRGPAFGDLAAEECLRVEANRLEENRLTAVEDRIEAELALGRDRELVAEIEALVAEQPLRERLRGHQMLALYRCGRQADALAAYTHARDYLVEKLGIEPGPALRDLERAVLEQDPALAGARDPAGRPPPPEAPAANAPRRMAFAGAVLLVLAIVAALLIDRAGRAPPRGAAAAGDSLIAIDPAINRVVDEVRVGDTPTRVNAGAGVVWALNADDRTVSRVDLKTKTVRTFSTGTTPIDLAAHGEELWLAQAAPAGRADEYLGAASVTQVDPVSGAGRRTATLAVPARAAPPLLPGELIAAGHDAIWAVARPGWVHRLDERTGRVSTARSLQALGIATGDGQVWIRDRRQRAVRLDPGSGRTLARVALPVDWIDALAVGANGVWLTASPDGTLWHVDTKTLAVRTIDVGEGADSVAVGAGAVWIGNSVGGTVTRVDPASDRVTARIRVGGAPRGVAVGGGRVWVSVAGTGSPAPAAGGLRPAARVRALPSPPCGRVLTSGGDPDVLIASQMPLRGEVDMTLPMSEAVGYVLRERRFRAGRLTVGYQSCDDAIAQTGVSDGPKCRLNARTYAENPAVVGVVGPYASTCAWLMLPVLNRAPGGPLALVSPSNADPRLVRAESDDVVADLYPSGQRGYARVHPSGDLEMAASAILARRLGHGSVFFLEDEEVATLEPKWPWFWRAADRIGLRIAGRASWSADTPGFRALAERVRESRAGAVYLNSGPESDVGPLLRGLRAVLGRDVAILGGPALLPASDLFAAAGRAARGVFVTVPGRSTASLGPRGRRFVHGFGATQPGGRVTHLDVYAAAATEVLLDAIARSDGTRASVTRALAATRLADSVVGPLALDAHGEPLAQPVTVIRVDHRRGRRRGDLKGTVPVEVITPPAWHVGARRTP